MKKTAKKTPAKKSPRPAPNQFSPPPAPPSAHNWATTDDDEIARRRWRALEESFPIANVDAAFPIYSNFRVRSGSGMTYLVELRDLATRAFSCQCVDFRINGLGTCKHVEAVLNHLQARFPRKFAQATQNGSERIDIVPDRDRRSIQVERGLDRLPPPPSGTCWKMRRPSPPPCSPNSSALQNDTLNQERILMKNKTPHYPAATLAYYGPTDQLATKAVCGIIPRADADVEDLHKWITNAGDIRRDPAIGAEIEAFLKQHGVKTVLSVDKIFGCPHEDGIDYPEGADCPFCPFWAGRDRFADQ